MQQIDRFKIEDTIGAGASGIVYAAYDPQLDRRVALKLLFAGDEQDPVEARAQLDREAKAMAKVSHPNVVPIYELGLHDGRLFIAMGLVSGVDLRATLAAAPRDWRQILDIFAAAGRGLEAVHQAGFLHRDFKPENVLVGQDDHVWLTDFGLARTNQEHTRSERGDGGVSVHTGIRGTPAYMAPEQLRGETIDARADLFSFCVGLREALVGARPFDGQTATALLVAIERGPPPWPRSARVPRWIRRVIDSGLNFDRAARPNDMRALLNELGRAGSRRVYFSAAAAVVVAALGVFAYQAETRCSKEADAMLSAAWDKPLRTRVHAILGGGPALEAALERFTQGFLPAAIESCRRSGEAALLEQQCLRQALYDVRAKLVLLDGGDAQAVAEVPTLLSKLPVPRDCLAIKTMLAPLPREPDRRAAIDRAYQTLATAKALDDAGKKAESRAVSNALADEAAALGYAPLNAAIQYHLGLAYLWEAPADAAAAFKRAMLAAETGHDDRSRVLATILRAVAMQYLGRLEQADDLLDQADAYLLQHENDFEALALLESFRAKVGQRRREFVSAAEHAQRALAFERRREGTSPVAQILHLVTLCTMQALAQRSEVALPVCMEARDIIVAAFGESHPRLLIVDNGISMALQAAQRWDDALAASSRALAIAERVYGADHAMLTMPLADHGSILLALGRPHDALRDLQRAHAIAAKTLGETHPEFVEVLIGEADAELATGHRTKAVALLRAARTSLQHIEAKADYLSMLSAVEQKLDQSAASSANIAE